MTAIEDVTDVKRSEFANRLLARTGELVSHSADYRATLERFPSCWCRSSPTGARSRSRATTGLVERVAIAHRDPARLARSASCASASRCAPIDAPIGDVIRTGEPQLIVVADEGLR